MGVTSESGFNTYRTYVVFLRRREAGSVWAMAGHTDNILTVSNLIRHNVSGHEYRVIDYSIDFHDYSSLVESYGSDVTEQFGVL